MNQTNPFAVTDAGIPGNDTVYPGRDGSRSVMAAVAKVNVGAITLDATVYGRLTLDGELTFQPALPRKGITIAKATKDAMLAAVEEHIAGLPLWQDAANRAESILTAPPAVNGGKLGAAAKLGSKLGTRLVAKPETAQPAASEPAKADKPTFGKAGK